MRATLITGASSGLGKELAKLYAKDGNNLVLVARNEKALNDLREELVNQYSINVDVFPADLSDIDEVKKVFAFTKQKEYFIDNLINNAGFGDRTDFKDMDIDFQIKMTNVNCNALLYFTRVYLDDMLANNEGHIINVGSIAGFVPGPYMSTYHATKGFVLLLGESISYEIRKTNVKLLTFCPGPFESNFVEKAHNDYTFNKIKPISAAKVAELAYKKSKKGKSLYIVGVKNRMTMFVSKLAPRKTVAKGSAATIKKEK